MTASETSTVHDLTYCFGESVIQTGRSTTPTSIHEHNLIFFYVCIYVFVICIMTADSTEFTKFNFLV